MEGLSIAQKRPAPQWFAGRDREGDTRVGRAIRAVVAGIASPRFWAAWGAGEGNGRERQVQRERVPRWKWRIAGQTWKGL